MTGTALHTIGILQRCMKYLVLNKIVIAFTVNNFVLISTCISVINMRICNELLNFFVSVYVVHRLKIYINYVILKQLCLPRVTLFIQFEY